MLHELPIRNVRLAACPVEAEQLTPVAGGHFCASCQRPVHDFTQADSAALAAAQAAAPDGRLCGRFRRSQLAPDSWPGQLQMRRRLRQFLLVAVLVLVQGLSARQAWAQVKPAPRPAVTAPLYALPGSMPLPTAPPDTATTAHAKQHTGEGEVFGVIVEQMPQLPGGMEGLMKFIRKNLRYPAEALRDELEGRVFVSFTVTRSGQITGAHIIKGLAPALDAEALRVIGLMPAWTPGKQNGQAVDVSYTVPLTFTIREEKPRKKHR